MIKVYPNKDTDEYSLDYIVSLKWTCPYCNTQLFIIDNGKIENNFLTFFWCCNCDKCFVSNKKFMGLGISYEAKEIKKTKKMTNLIANKMKNPLIKKEIEMYRKNGKRKRN